MAEAETPAKFPAKKNALWLMAGACILLLWLFLDSKSPLASSGEKVTRTLPMTMSTSAHVTIIPDAEMKVSVDKAVDKAFAAIKHIDSLMSRYNPASDISRLNSAKTGDWVAVDPLTWKVLLNAQKFNRLSEGAFDCTVGPLIKLYWKDGKLATRLPAKEELQPVLAHVGSGKIEFQREGMRVRHTVKGMVVDLGAIAKGFAVDEAKRALEESGVKNAVIEIGGEVWLMGRKPASSTQMIEQQVGDGKSKAKRPQGSSWVAGIRHPRAQELIGKVERSDCAVATSGDYEKYFEIGGVRYSHIIDPRSGLPVHGGVVSATIVSPRSCMEADALATSVSVLGPEKGHELLSLFPGVEAILVIENSDGELKVEKFKTPADFAPPSE